MNKGQFNELAELKFKMKQSNSKIPHNWVAVVDESDLFVNDKDRLAQHQSFVLFLTVKFKIPSKGPYFNILH